MTREQMETILRTAENGTSQQKSILAEFLFQMVTGNIHVLLALAADTDAQVRNAALSALEQVAALIEHEGR